MKDNDNVKSFIIDKGDVCYGRRSKSKLFYRR